MQKKILIVDDEAIVRDSVEVSLKKDGYQVFGADCGEEGIRMAKEVKPDLVILDLMMPDKWGYAVCDELKASPETKDAAILFLTGRKSSASRKMGEIKGGDEYIVKPFDPSELRKKVKKLLGLE